MGQKPDDWRAVSLCNDCHNHDQHQHGEPTFWREYHRRTGATVFDLIDAFCKASPVAREIREARQQ